MFGAKGMSKLSGAEVHSNNYSHYCILFALCLFICTMYVPPNFVCPPL